MEKFVPTYSQPSIRGFPTVPTSRRPGTDIGNTYQLVFQGNTIGVPQVPAVPAAIVFD